MKNNQAISLSSIQASAVSFGSKFNLEKLVNCSALAVGWRVRRPTIVFALRDVLAVKCYNKSVLFGLSWQA